MPKAKTKSKSTGKSTKELDGVFILKVVLYVIIGSQWLRLTDPALTKQLPVPVGLIIGGWFAAHDHFQIDRKIEYALLVIACLVGYWSQVGLSLAFLK